MDNIAEQMELMEMPRPCTPAVGEIWLELNHVQPVRLCLTMHPTDVLPEHVPVSAMATIAVMMGSMGTPAAFTTVQEELFSMPTTACTDAPPILQEPPILAIGMEEVPERITITPQESPRTRLEWLFMTTMDQKESCHSMQPTIPPTYQAKRILLILLLPEILSPFTSWLQFSFPFLSNTKSYFDQIFDSAH